MPRTMRTPLIRDPADWARDAGWVSRIRAKRAADRLRALGSTIRDALNDEGGELWAAELEEVAAYLEKNTGGARRAPRGHA